MEHIELTRAGVGWWEFTCSVLGGGGGPPSAVGSTTMLHHTLWPNCSPRCARRQWEVYVPSSTGAMKATLTKPTWPCCRKGTATSFCFSQDARAMFPHMNFSCREKPHKCIHLGIHTPTHRWTHRQERTHTQSYLVDIRHSLIWSHRWSSARMLYINWDRLHLCFNLYVGTQQLESTRLSSA